MYKNVWINAVQMVYKKLYIPKYFSCRLGTPK